MEEKLNEILEKIKEINYGWVDKNGVLHKKSSRNFFIDNYRLQTIDETLVFKVGTCWEQVELIRYYLEKEDIPVETYIVIYNDDKKIARHSIAVVQDEEKFYWLENSWILGNCSFIFNSVEEILEKLIDSFPKMYKIHDFDISKIEIYKYKKPEFGLTYYEFTEYCRNQEAISLEHYWLKKLNEFYIYANKGFYIDEILEKDSYKLAYSHFVKDYDCNYVIDINDRENFQSIEEDVIKEMKWIDAKPCYIITPLSKLYSIRDKIFTKDKYENVNNEVWQIFDKLYDVPNIKSKCCFNVKLEKSTDMKKLAEVNDRAFRTGDPTDPYGNIDSGYLKIYENYKGTLRSKYSRDFYLIKIDNQIIGTTVSVYDDRIFGIYGIAIFKEYRGNGIGTEVLKQQLNIARKKNKKVVFLQTEEGYYPAKLYRKLGFKDVCNAYYYVLK